MPRKGENIYKRKDGRWEGRYLKSRSPSGKAQYGYIYAKTYREVKEKLRDAQHGSHAVLPITDTSTDTIGAIAKLLCSS